MPPELLAVQDLPQRPATQVKNGWAPVARAVQEAGCVAITNHATVEAVILSVKAYEELISQAARGRERQQQALDDLTTRFKARLASLQSPDAKDRVDALFKARGKGTYRSKAGSSY
jgi:PHD/YefM family antitoxin component YafN of YafNO toxin-antitoxin module